MPEEKFSDIVLVYSCPAYILFDFDATHCFISSKFISKHDTSHDTVHWGWTISTGNGVMPCN